MLIITTKLLVWSLSPVCRKEAVDSLTATNDLDARDRRADALSQGRQQRDHVQ